MIETIDLSYEVDGKMICDHINLKFKENVITGLVGPNGSGKSTFLKQIYRAIEPTEGKILIDDKDIRKYSIKESSQMIGVMTQENASDFSFTVGEVVLMGRAPYLEFYSSYGIKDYELAKNALEKVGMLDKMEQNYRSLSGGEKQRVLLARALTQDTSILILDEPTNHLDIGYQYKVFDILKKLNKTIVIAVHDLNFAVKYCDEIALFSGGVLIKQGESKDVFTQEMLKEIFDINCSLVIEDGNLKHINILGAC